MDFRLAEKKDLPQLKTVYKDIIQNMDAHQIQIWDDIYPCSLFEEDIKNNRLYVLAQNDELVAAFTLCTSDPGEKSVKWKHNQGKALYLERFGVNVNYSRKGTGSLMVAKAIDTARSLDAAFLRLFVVDINEPAVRLYEKSGFIKADGIYDEVIDDELVLRQYGYEIKIPMEKL